MLGRRYRREKLGKSQELQQRLSLLTCPRPAGHSGTAQNLQQYLSKRNLEKERIVASMVRAGSRKKGKGLTRKRKPDAVYIPDFILI